MLRELAGEGWKFTGIRVRVQARPAAEPAAKRYIKQLDETSASTLRELALKVGEGPLATALERLVRDAGPGKRLGDGDQALESIKEQDGQQ